MLTFNLKKEWFDKIVSGEKTHEYREVKDYWTKRITKAIYGVALNYDADYCECDVQLNYICFMNGMISEEKQPRIYAKLKSIRIINGKNTDLAIDKPVYDIEFKVIKE